MAKVVCLECGQVNRVPSERLAAGPKCGTCGARLLDGTVRVLDPAVLAKAATTDELPLVVDFWAPWCGPCRMMAPELEKAARTMAQVVRFAKIDTEAHPGLSGSYGIRGIPLLVAFQGGRERARQAGAQPAAGIEAWVRRAVRV